MTTRGMVMPLALDRVIDPIRLTTGLGTRVCAVCGDIGEPSITVNTWTRPITLCVECGVRIGEVAKQQH